MPKKEEVIVVWEGWRKGNRRKVEDSKEVGSPQTAINVVFRSCSVTFVRQLAVQFAAGIKSVRETKHLKLSFLDDGECRYTWQRDAVHMSIHVTKRRRPHDRRVSNTSHYVIGEKNYFFFSEFPIEDTIVVYQWTGQLVSGKWTVHVGCGALFGPFYDSVSTLLTARKSAKILKSTDHLRLAEMWCREVGML